MPASTAFDFADLQGLVRFGHGRLRAACLSLLEIRDVAAARAWLAQAPVSAAETQSPVPDTALQVAFTAQGLRRLELAEATIRQFSDEFIAGMHDPDRSRHLGDTDANAPAHWHWGGSEQRVPHVLLMLYALPGRLDDLHAEIAGELFTKAFAVQQQLTSNHEVLTEPFGFADGISQPSIDWLRDQTTDNHRRDSYSNLLALGEVVLGYPNEYGEYTSRPLLSPARDPRANMLPEAENHPDLRDLGRNGSYLVLRQLEQDVSGFWNFIDAAAGNDAEKGEQLAAAMVGRHRDGRPLVALSEPGIAGIPADSRHNNFSFDSDPHGVACPVAAHIRRSNPRSGDFPPGTGGFFSRLIRILGFDSASRDLDLVASTRFHRILRRGRQYGPLSTRETALQPTTSGPERGLHFVCLVANIRRQFEFVQNAWTVNGKFAGLQDEEDPLTGNRKPLYGGTPTAQFSQPQTSGIRSCTAALPQFVTVRGGAYFFLPGIRALRYLAAVPSVAVTVADAAAGSQSLAPEAAR